ncbi:MAG TPA: hypothetical protein VJ724_07480, partial [Tahibacter sp.]|nr:hypothetical protein [Tahibacter sp.]
AAPLAAAFALAALLAAGDRSASAGTVRIIGKAQAPAGDAIALTVGLMLDDGDPNACGTAQTLAVHVGDAVNFCYTVTNASGLALGYHTLVDSVDGEIFSLLHHDLAPGESFQFNRVVTVQDGVDTYDATWTAQDYAPGYRPVETAPDFVDVRATGTPLGLGDDGVAGVTLPFAFSLYGISSADLAIGNNGELVFGTLDAVSAAFNDTLPSTFAILGQGALIAPFWDDLGEADGDVYWEVVGTAPNRRAVIQWDRPHFLFDDGGHANVEAMLGEDGSLSFQYASTVFGDPANPDWDNGGSATVGLQNADASIGNLYSFDTPVVTSPLAIEWIATTPTAFTANATATLDVSPALVPATISVTPTPIDASAAAGDAPVDVPVRIANAGDMDLSWNLVEAPGGTSTRSQASVDRATSSPVEHKIAANDATRDRFRSRAPQAPVVRGEITPGCDAATPGMLLHDDGAPEDGYRDGSGLFSINAYVDRFTPSVYPATLTTACVSFLTLGPTAQDFDLIVYDDTGFDGGPGNLIASVPATATDIPDTATAAFVKVDLSGLGISIPSGSVYIGAQWNPLDPGDVFIASDTNGDADAGHGYHMRGSDLGLGSWDRTIEEFADYHALLVRAVEAPDYCATPADVPWLTLSETSGSVAAHDSGTITATLDPSGLANGTYAATLCIASNDPAHPRLVVPVRFEVGDRIFASGFDP